VKTNGNTFHLLLYAAEIAQNISSVCICCKKGKC